jgi:putative intracellular protease/amidase
MAEREIIMAKVYAFLADGLEEVECLAVVDVLRRSGDTGVCYGRQESNWFSWN